MPLFQEAIITTLLSCCDHIVMTTLLFLPCYDHLVNYLVTTTLQPCLCFQEVVMTDVLCLHSVVTPNYLPAKFPIWKLPIPEL